METVDPTQIDYSEQATMQKMKLLTPKRLLNVLSIFK